jgi:C-terminal processing protease CtpA/Prc
MNILRTMARAAIAFAAAGLIAFAGEPAKEAGSTETPAKKCPYTTQECLNSMAVKMKASGWIGIEYDPEKEMAITRVVPGSPAEKAGLLVGDHLASMNGIAIRPENEEAILKARKQWAPGQVVHYTIKRNEVTKQVDITLGEWPADLLARYIGEHMLQHAEYDAAAKPAPK